MQNGFYYGGTMTHFGDLYSDNAVHTGTFTSFKVSLKALSPSPLLVGSTTVSVIAAATAASIAFPPEASMRNPAAVASGWLVATYRFPGRRALGWALILPLAMPAYVLAYAYTDFLQVTGTAQTLIRSATGWGWRDYWFPDIRSLGGAVFVLTAALYPYVYVLARGAFSEQAVCALEVGRTLGCGPRTCRLRSRKRLVNSKPTENRRSVKQRPKICRYFSPRPRAPHHASVP